MNLQEEWKRCWKWLSVNIAALAVIAPQVYAQSDMLQGLLPSSLFRIVQFVLGVAVIWAIVKKKKS